MASMNSRFEQELVERKLLNPAQLNELKGAGKNASGSLFQSLLGLKTISPADLYQAAAGVWAVPYIEIQSSEYRISDEPGLPDSVLDKLGAITLIDTNDTHLVALGSPDKLSQIDQLRFFTRQELTPVLADIHQIHKYRNQQQHRINKPASQPQDDNSLLSYLSRARSCNASDIHIEPFDGYCRMRTRVDGILHPLESISPELGRQLITQIKLLAGMDIAQSRLPQDGRFSTETGQQPLSLRVNSIPTINGEKLVLRLLEQHGQRFKLDKIGLFTDQFHVVRQILKRPGGLILITGPTGSGKTVTLYALLEMLNTGRENISTIEDPVEIYEDGINQISINRKAGLEFSQALRALLRQDPDILMVGEIRDRETAEIAVKAAQTGHLVMATLHTRSAANARTRLLQLGVEKHALNEALRLVIAQRLPRRLCVHCRKPTQVPESMRQRINSVDAATIKTAHRAVGCEHCMQGYSGRTGIFELLCPSPRQELNGYAAQPAVSWSLEQAGFQRVLDGSTSYEELIRVL